MGESYLDVIQRLEPVIIEMERERESLCVIAHQAILRVIYGYFTQQPIESIPTITVPLHTVIELTPYPDGKMKEQRCVRTSEHSIHCYLVACVLVVAVYQDNWATIVFA